jgi:hypothetical protein
MLVVLGPLHMIEQMLTSIDEFYWLRGEMAELYVWFAPLPADIVSVMLITIVWTTVSMLFYAVLVGGTPRLLVLALFGLFGASEVHHVFQALAKGSYDAGIITCIPYTVVGYLLVSEVWQALRHAPVASGAATRFA